jgi:hypothetical protein
MVNQTSTFSLNVHVHEGFDCNDTQLELGNLVENSRLVVGSISTPSGPFCIWKHCNTQWLGWRSRNCILCLPWHFFVVNDGSKLDPILLQTMHCVICLFVCQSYNVGNTTKRKKFLISYNQQHGIISMKKYILGEHLATWHKWKSANVAFDLEELRPKK